MRYTPVVPLRMHNPPLTQYPIGLIVSVSYRLFNCDKNLYDQLEIMKLLKFNLPQYKLIKNPSFEILKNILNNYTVSISDTTVNKKDLYFHL